MIFVDYPGHFVALLAIVLTAAAIFVGFRTAQFQTADRRIYRPLLMLLQAAAVAILLLILWNPCKQRSTKVYGSNEVLAVFDTSQSMSVVEEKRPNRLDLALDGFVTHFHPDSPAGPRYRVYGFDAHAYHCGSVELLRRWGEQTNLHNAISEISNLKSQISDSPSRAGLAGMVIFTDGQSPDKNPRDYPALGSEGLPVLLVGVGSRKSARDTRVASIEAPARVWLESTYTMTSQIDVTQAPSEPVVVELLCDGRSVDRRSLAKEQFIATSLGESRAGVQFSVPASELGTHVLTIRATPQKDEVTTVNNSRATTVEVTQEEPLRVLLYSQWAGFDIGKIRQALAWNKRIEVDFGLDAVKDRSLSEAFNQAGGYVKLPRNDAEYFQYDVIILGPCDLSQLTADQLNVLYRFVAERGGGLLLLPGPTVTSLAAWQDERGNALLPVVLKESQERLWPPHPDAIKMVRDAEAASPLDPNAFTQQDRSLSAYYDVAMVKPASTTLAIIGAAPLITIQRLGRGRVCLFNAIRLFRLYREDDNGGSLTQVLSDLVAELGRTAARGSGIDLFVERKAENPRRVVFTARVLDKDFRPADRANVLLSVGGEVTAMKAIGAGRYEAETDIGPAQSVVAGVQAESGGVFLGERTVAANLPPVQDEMSDVRLDEGFLRELAVQIGAKYIHIDELTDRASDAFVPGRQVGTVQTTRSVWPTWPLLAVLCSLLTLKWFLRRAIGLV